MLPRGTPGFLSPPLTPGFFKQYSSSTFDIFSTSPFCCRPKPNISTYARCSPFMSRSPASNAFKLFFDPAGTNAFVPFGNVRLNIASCPEAWNLHHAFFPDLQNLKNKKRRRPSRFDFVSHGMQLRSMKITQCLSYDVNLRILNITYAKVQTCLFAKASQKQCERAE